MLGGAEKLVPAKYWCSYGTTVTLYHRHKYMYNDKNGAQIDNIDISSSTETLSKLNICHAQINNNICIVFLNIGYCIQTAGRAQQHYSRKRL